MKKFIGIIVSLSLISVLFAEELSTKENYLKKIAKKHLLYLNLSLGPASGGSIGIGKIQYSERPTKEITVNFHYLKCKDYFVTGIYGQMNFYRSKQRKGIFTTVTGGIDYTKGEQKIWFGNIGGPDESDNDKEKFEGIYPNLTIGCGYGIKLSQSSRMLIYLDLGFKKTISNLNVAISF